jgi:asparagine N-glycosylation enzyme membrane subunit Stt3
MEIVRLGYGFFWEDLGLIGFYIVIGAITLLGLLWYTIKAIYIKVPPDNLYISIYFIYLLIVSLTTMEIYRPGIFVVEAIGLYLIDVGVIEDKFSEK